MAKSERRSPTREKLQKYINENPNAYLEKSYETIANEIGTSPISVWRHLPNLIAQRDGCLPSEIVEKRKQQGFDFGQNTKLKPEKIEEIKELSKTLEPIDIAYKLDIDIRTVKAYLETFETEAKAKE